MKVEKQEVVVLMPEEKKTINEVSTLMLDILEQVDDPDIYNATKQVSDALESFSYLVETE